MFQWLYYYWCCGNNKNFFYWKNQLYVYKIFINYYCLIPGAIRYDSEHIHVWVFKYFLITRLLVFYPPRQMYWHTIEINVFDQLDVKNSKNFFKNTVLYQKNFFKKFSFFISQVNNMTYNKCISLQNNLSSVWCTDSCCITLIDGEYEHPAYMHTYNSWLDSVCYIFTKLMTQITQTPQTSEDSLIFKLDDHLMQCEDCCLNWRFNVHVYRHAVRQFTSFYIFGRTRIIKRTTLLFAAWLNQWRPHICMQQITNITLYAAISCLFCWQSTTFYLLCLHFFKFTVNGIFIENFFTLLVVGDCLKFSCTYFLYYFFSLQCWQLNLPTNQFLSTASYVEKQLTQHNIKFPSIFFFAQPKTKFHYNALLFNVFDSFYYLHAWNNFYLTPSMYFLNLLKIRSQFFFFTDVLTTGAVILHEIAYNSTLCFSDLKNFFIQCLIFFTTIITQVILQYSKCLIKYFFFNLCSNNKIFLKHVTFRCEKYLNYFFLFYQKFFISFSNNLINTTVFYRKIFIFDIYAHDTCRYVFCDAFKCIAVDINEINLQIVCTPRSQLRVQLNLIPHFLSDFIFLTTVAPACILKSWLHEFKIFFKYRDYIKNLFILNVFDNFILIYQKYLDIYLFLTNLRESWNLINFFLEEQFPFFIRTGEFLFFNYATFKNFYNAFSITIKNNIHKDRYIVAAHRINLVLCNTLRYCKIASGDMPSLRAIVESNQILSVININLYTAWISCILNSTTILSIPDTEFFLCIFFLQRFVYFKLNPQIQSNLNNSTLHKTQYTNLFMTALQLIYRNRASITQINQQTKITITSINKEILFFCFKNSSIESSIDRDLYARRYAYQSEFSTIKYYFIKKNNFLTNFFNYTFAAQWLTLLEQTSSALYDKNALVEIFEKANLLTIFFIDARMQWLFSRYGQLQDIHSLDSKITHLARFNTYQMLTKFYSHPQFFLRHDAAFIFDINNLNATVNSKVDKLDENMLELHRFFDEFNALSFESAYPLNSSTSFSANEFEGDDDSEIDLPSTPDTNLPNADNSQGIDTQIKTFSSNESITNEAVEIANTHHENEKMQTPIYLQSVTYATTHRAYFSNTAASLATTERYLSFEVDWFTGQAFYINRYQVITMQMLLQHIAPYRCASQLNWKYL